MYLGKSCQSKISYFAILCLILFTSCSELETEIVQKDAADPAWNSGPERFIQRELSGDISIHPFYDLVPFSSKFDNGINFFPLFSSSDHAFYDFNLSSGKVFARHRFCPRKDIWKKHGGKLIKSNFTYGIVPRLLDQIGMPQNILVFGNSDLYNNLSKSIAESHRVRVVGGVLEQFCKEYPCSTSNKWISRLVLIAVDMNDKEFSDVRDIPALKEKVDWKYARTFLENLQGGTKSNGNVRPAYRVIGEIDPKRSLDTAVKKGHLFRFKEMMSLKKGCHKLYDHIWNSVSLVREGKGKYKTFSKFFADFHPEFGKQYRNCSKLVAGSTLNSNIERFWFFSFLNAFFEMENAGYIYQCTRLVWKRNLVNPFSGKRSIDPSKNFNHCTDSGLDYAFEMAPVMLKGISTSGRSYSKFIEYDSESYGGHQRVFSWTRWTGKEYQCLDDKGDKVTSVKGLFPSDIVWRRFYKKNINRSLLIK